MQRRRELTPRDDFRAIGSSPTDQGETAPLPAEVLSACVVIDPPTVADNSSSEALIPFGDLAPNEDREGDFPSPDARSGRVIPTQKTDQQLLNDSELFDTEWYLRA